MWSRLFSSKEFEIYRGYLVIFGAALTVTMLLLGAAVIVSLAQALIEAVL